MNLVTDERIIHTVKGRSVTAQRVIDLLIGLYENGCSSWLNSAGALVYPEGTERADFKAGGRFNPSDYDPVRAVVVTHEGGALKWGVEVPVKSVVNFRDVIITLADVRKGLEVMAEKYPKHFADIVDENDDATTADLLGQCIVYHTEVYS